MLCMNCNFEHADKFQSDKYLHGVNRTFQIAPFVKKSQYSTVLPNVCFL